MREKHRWIASCTCHEQGWNTQPSFEPWPGIKPAVFWHMGWRSIQLGHWGRQGYGNFKYILLLIAWEKKSRSYNHYLWTLIAIFYHLYSPSQSILYLCLPWNRENMNSTKNRTLKIVMYLFHPCCCGHIAPVQFDSTQKTLQGSSK